MEPPPPSHHFHSKTDLRIAAQVVRTQVRLPVVAGWYGYDYPDYKTAGLTCPKCVAVSKSRKTLSTYEDGERWWCFHCGEGGDVIDWIAAAEGCGKGPAIANLAARLGVEIGGDWLASFRTLLRTKREMAGAARLRPEFGAVRRAASESWDRVNHDCGDAIHARINSNIHTGHPLAHFLQRLAAIESAHDHGGIAEDRALSAIRQLAHFTSESEVNTAGAVFKKVDTAQSSTMEAHAMMGDAPSSLFLRVKDSVLEMVCSEFNYAVHGAVDSSAVIADAADAYVSRWVSQFWDGPTIIDQFCRARTPSHPDFLTKQRRMHLGWCPQRSTIASNFDRLQKIHHSCAWSLRAEFVQTVLAGHSPEPGFVLRTSFFPIVRPTGARAVSAGCDQDVLSACRLKERPDNPLGPFRSQLVRAAGLVRGGFVGPKRDTMENRIVWPVRGPNGLAIALAGRLIDGEGPKYLNTKNTAAFDKGSTLYGLNPKAFGRIRDSGLAVIVEGYFDVEALQGHGVPIALAPMGSRITRRHAETLRRCGARKVVAIFDGDAAGDEAADAAADTLRAARIGLGVVRLARGMDPDDWVFSVGGQSARDSIRAAASSRPRRSAASVAAGVRAMVGRAAPRTAI